MLTWNPAKEVENIRKHGYDFAAIEAIFENPVLSWQDNRVIYGELRINLLGWLHGRVMHLTYTDDGEIIRAISLRAAEKHEVRKYQQALSKHTS